jgi:hypothetical protein
MTLCSFLYMLPREFNILAAPPVNRVTSASHRFASWKSAMKIWRSTRPGLTVGRGMLDLNAPANLSVSPAKTSNQHRRNELFSSNDLFAHVRTRRQQ